MEKPAFNPRKLEIGIWPLERQEKEALRKALLLVAAAALGVMSQVDGPEGAWFRGRFQERIDFWDRAEQEWLTDKRAQWESGDWEDIDLGEFYRQIETLTEGVGQGPASREAEQLQHKIVRHLRELYKQGVSKGELARILVKTDLNPNEHIASMTYRTLGYGGNCLANFRFYASVWAELFPEDIRYMREDQVLIKDVTTGKEVPHARLVIDLKAFDPGQPRGRHWVQLDRRKVVKTDSAPNHDEDIRKTALDELALAKGWAVEASTTVAGEASSRSAQFFRVGQRRGFKQARKVEFADPTSGTTWEADLEDSMALEELRMHAEQFRPKEPTSKPNRQKVEKKYKEELRDALASSTPVFAERDLDPLGWLTRRGPVQPLPPSSSVVQLITSEEARERLEKKPSSQFDEHLKDDLDRLGRIMDEMRHLIESGYQLCSLRDYYSARSSESERALQKERIENSSDYFELMSATRQAFTRQAESRGFELDLDSVVVFAGEAEWRFRMSGSSKDCAFSWGIPSLQKTIIIGNTTLAHELDAKSEGVLFAGTLIGELEIRILQTRDEGNLSSMPPLDLGSIVHHEGLTPEEMATYLVEVALGLEKMEEEWRVKFVDWIDVRRGAIVRDDRMVPLAPLFVSEEQMVPEALFLTPYMMVVTRTPEEVSLAPNVLAGRGVRRVKYRRWDGSVVEAVNDYQGPYALETAIIPPGFDRTRLRPLLPYPGSKH